MKPIERKNHVAAHGKTLDRQLKNNFGDLNALKTALMNVDSAKDQLLAAKALGQMDKKNQLYLEYGDRIHEILTNQIDATVLQNQHDADLLKRAGKGAIQIQKAQSGVQNANSKYLQDRSLNALQHQTVKQNQLQNYNISRSEFILKNQIDLALQMENFRARVAGQIQRVELEQIKANEEVKKIRINGYLQQGDAFSKALPYKKRFSLGEKATNVLSRIGASTGLLV